MSLPPPDPGAPRFPQALVLMVKVPRSGACKTRLCPPLTSDEASELYAAFLVDIAREVEAWASGIDLWVAWTDEPVLTDPRDTAAQDPACPPAPSTDFANLFGSSFRFLRQEDGTLAERMDAVFATLFRQGYQQVVMRNSDSPHLPGTLQFEAFEALAEGRGSLVLGPDLDGGYYLVGLDVPSERLFPDMMSTSSVLDDTVARARGQGLSVVLLEPFLDIDTPDDLLTFWLEFGNRADVRNWSTWQYLHDHPLLSRLGD